MNKNKSDNNTEAIKIANALKPFVKNWFDEWGQSCVRSKKMTVTTAPNGSVIGVKDAFSDTEIFIKYMSSCANAIVGDTVWVKWMYDNMQTLFADRIGNFDRDNYVPVSGGTFTGNVEFNSVVDITNRKASASLSSAGWYRVCTYESGGSGGVTGGHGFAVRFNIQKHTSAENHSITLRASTSSTFAWCDESSLSTTQLIDKIRYTYNPSNYYGYVDIHFTGTTERGVCVDFDVFEAGNNAENVIAYQGKWKSNKLTSVADSPTGETVLSEHTFAKTCYGFGYMGYAKVISTDFNNVTRAGIYYLDDTTMTNAPSSYKWGYLIVFDNAGTVQKTQMVVYTTSNGQITSTRTYSGTTPAWGSWRTQLDNSYGNLMNTGYRPYTDGSAVSVPTATWKSVCSLTLDAGRWLVYATGRFNTNANGTHRSIRVSTSADSSGGTTVQFTDYRSPTSGTYTYCKSMDMAVISTQTTYYINAYQDSGSSLDVTGRLYAVRIA